MKWDYETICLLEMENKDSLLFKPLKFEQSIMKSYFMWLWIHGFEFDLSLNYRREYLVQHYSISTENLVFDILNLEISKEEQEILVYFYYLTDGEIESVSALMSKSKEKVKKLYEEVKDTYLNQKNLLLKEMEDENFLERLVNVSFDQGVKVIPYIGLIGKKQMNLHYVENKRVIIALGYEFVLDTVQPYNHQETLEKLKALGDETRLSIVELILKKKMSASELANVLGLTIPTIAHHLKVLASAGIISSFVEKGSGSKVSYKIYNQGLDNLINNINYLNSGGVK
jgi:DNA-binding transcriptional ArsR family regulator